MERFCAEEMQNAFRRRLEAAEDRGLDDRAVGGTGTVIARDGPCWISESAVRWYGGAVPPLATARQ